MIYEEERATLCLSCREFITLCRRGFSASLPLDEEEPEYPPQERRLRRKYFGEEKPVRLSLPFSAGDYRFELTAVADGVEGETVSLLCPTGYSPAHPPKSWVSEIRGEGYVAAYAYALCQGLERVTLRLILVNPLTEEENLREERLTLTRLQGFFDKCTRRMLLYAPPAIDRATRRLPYMKQLAFPYRQVREGQDAFMAAVHRAIRHGTRLYANAPTGTGKTVSALYPALRAMGEGYGEKIFYLTPKTTTGAVAAECLCRMAPAGEIRAVILSAKEKICENDTLCRRGESCTRTAENHLADAVLALWGEGGTVAEAAKIRQIAGEKNVCPYELSLAYAELCDVVICDFNYLFDPAVYLRRFFDRPGDYIFLIDEAHNLPDRASTMYSAQISEEEISSLLPILGEHAELSSVIPRVKDDFCKLLFAYTKENLRKDESGQDYGVSHGRQLPEGLFPLFGRLCAAAERALYDACRDRSDAGNSMRRAIGTYYYGIRRFYQALERFDGAYEYFMIRENDNWRLKLFCIDPGRTIAERLSCGRCAVFFSGTLSPIGYYKTLLGADGASEVLAVDSPFDPSQLSVSVMDKISLRTSERERTLPAVLRVIAATISAKHGHYMIFSPSFTYNAMLADLFRRKYPKLRVMEQKRGMSDDERKKFLAAFSEEDAGYLVAFCVMGGVYAEGIDLCGDKLIGAVIVGVGMPQISLEREAMCAYFDEKYESGKPYAYVYPGMNKVLQAAGRVIRREDDRGVIVLIDDRFADPVYRKAIPALWHGWKFVSDAGALRMDLDAFWATDAPGAGIKSPKKIH